MPRTVRISTPNGSSLRRTRCTYTSIALLPTSYPVNGFLFVLITLLIVREAWAMRQAATTTA